MLAEAFEVGGSLGRVVHYSHDAVLSCTAKTIGTM